MKKILSSVLIAVLMFTTVITAIPFGAEAAYSPSTAVAEKTLTSGEIEKIFSDNKPTASNPDDVLGLYAYNFASAREMLDYELSKGYLSSVTYGDYTLYINVYTGYLYYVNNVTGQVISSNPYDIGYLKKNPSEADVANRFTSQVVFEFLKTSDSSVNVYASSLWAGKRQQISVTYIKNGFRVNYTLGDTSSRCLLPVAVEATKFEESILIPMIDLYYDTLKSALDKFGAMYDDEEINFFASETFGSESVYKGEHLNPLALETYLSDTKTFMYMVPKSSDEYKLLNDLNIAITRLGTGIVYALKDANAIIEEFNANKENGKDNTMPIRKLNNMFEEYPVTGYWDGDPENGGTPVAGMAIYSLGNPTLETDNPLNARTYANYIVNYADYTYSDLFTDESDAGISVGAIPKPVFRCALEYVLNDDGSIDVTLPASSISFDESLYTLNAIVPLEYFGCGVTTAGYETYSLFPDGSGMITDFTDHKNVNHKRPLYGTDYAYSQLNTTFEYLEQITMPVFGMVTETPSSSDPTKHVLNGYFAIVKDGSALANMGIFSGGTTSKYANAYVSYAPYPSDTFDLTETITVGNVTAYTLTLESKYSGSYVTNITMLTDPDIANDLGLDDAYVSSYVGMAARYRDYLIANGELSAITEYDEEHIPLYIEALGTIEVIKKYLTFPVNVNIPLTTFDDVLTMYNELANAKQTLSDMSDEYKALADATPADDPLQKEFYLEKSAEYAALSAKVDNITNVNFKLTGFANDGMRYTYPTKVKWEKACGGKSGFRDLVAQAESITTTTDGTLGVYPEFDFMFLMSDELFDGVSRWDTARMIDNRYASKQIYNPANRQYDRGFGSIISTASLSKLFGKFESKYSKYNWKYLSLSTFGSILNSNFDEDNPVNRDTSCDYVTSILDGLVKDGYSIMVDKGNAYTYKYVDHIVDISIDSSHHAYSSYTVPFIGMVLHGYVNYAGGALNYSGSSAYDLLRSIENGANLYYILCYQNTNEMKDEKEVSKYYSVNYATWFERIAETYTELNSVIKELQTYKIVDHKTIIAEKTLSQEVIAANAGKLQSEFIALLDKEITTAANAKLDELRASGAADKSLKITVDVAALVAQFVEITKTPAEFAGADFEDMINDRVAYWTSYYFATASGANEISVSNVCAADAIASIKDGFVALVATELRAALDAKKAELEALAVPGEPVDYSLKLTVDVDALVAQLIAAEADAPAYYFDEAFKASIRSAVAAIAQEYEATDAGVNEVAISALSAYASAGADLDYVPAYDYFTNSIATDKDYDTTFYSVTNYNVVMVTYRNDAGDEVSFVLNYNIDTVTVDLGGGNTFDLEKYSYRKI